MAALDRALDDPWRADRDYIIADMNGSAVFLLAALKMRLGLAALRCGVDAERAGRNVGRSSRARLMTCRRSTLGSKAVRSWSRGRRTCRRAPS